MSYEKTKKTNSQKISDNQSQMDEKKMARIGILTCSNMTQDLACSSAGCLEALNAGEGEFELYSENGGKAALVGIINCSGCPTLFAPEKLLKRVRSLTALGLDSLHFAFCVKKGCPFKNKYLKILKENFPELSIVVGTHAEPSEAMQEKLAEEVKSLLVKQTPTMIDLIANFREMRESS